MISTCGVRKNCNTVRCADARAVVTNPAPGAGRWDAAPTRPAAIVDVVIGLLQSG